VVLSFAIILAGVGWLLAELELIDRWGWIWSAVLAASGIQILITRGMNRMTLIVGPYLIICSGFSILRLYAQLPVRYEIPSLVIAFGVVMLVVTLLGYAVPELLLEEKAS
jgi:hypothetical protein